MTDTANPVVAEDVDRILAHPLRWDALSGETVLVTGASGFVPAYLVETMAALNSRGASIRIVGLVRSRERAHKRFSHLLSSNSGLELIEHDVARQMPPDLPRAQYVFHAASQATPRLYGIDPVGTLEANTFGTSNMLRYAVDSGAISLVYFSSGEVYGIPQDDSRPLAESDFGYSDPATVRACYAESKRMGETLCVCWAHQHGVPAKIVRPFHTYGPGMSLTDGRVFADFVSDVVARRNVILKSDGLAMRPFCYLADATIAFFSVLLKGQTGQAYNVGNPEAETSIICLAQLMVGLYPELGLSVQYMASPTQTAGYIQSAVKRSIPHIGRMAELGWRPLTSLEEGFRRTVKSFDPSLN